MDKLTQYFAVLKKYQFWFICATVSLVTLICYVAASSGLARQTSARTKQLEGKFKAVKVEPNHPNQAVIEAIQKKDDTLKHSVYEAWQILYSRQKKNNPLPAVLDKDFKTHFESLKPREELAPVYREQYQNFILRELPTLLTLVDARRQREDKRQPSGDAGAKGAAIGSRVGPGQGNLAGRFVGPAAGRGETTEEDLVGIVDWNPADYSELEGDFSGQKKGFYWKARPSTLEVELAQENLWVIQALLRVIRKTNDGATSNASAAVKQIVSLQFGKEAAAAWKHGVAAVTATTGGGRYGGKGEDMGAGGRTGKTTALGEEGSRQQLIEGRYVDSKGEPVPYDEEAPRYATHPYSEFVMMPIRMSLVMDQRRVSRLLVECANSSMPIEVRQVQLTKTPGSVLDFGGDSRGGRGGGKGSDSGKGGRGGYVPHGQAFGGRGAGGGNQTDASPYDIPVEILGIIYIYNPPTTGTTTTEQVDEEAAPAEPAPAATPGKNP